MAQKGIGVRVISIDPAIAKIAHQQVIAEPVKIRRRNRQPPGRVQRAPGRNALEERHEVQVTLAGQGVQRPIKLPGDVIWCVATAEGTFCVGVRFQRRLTYADLQRLT